MANPSEPRALQAALSAPAFQTRSGSAALHVANRYVERWAPEASARRVRPLRTLGFVDRLVAPWVEAAQRSASIRVHEQYATRGPVERDPAAVSWVFPRPQYQDELAWMAAARQAAAAGASAAPAPTLLTTRGTYVARTHGVPAALHEYVAPSLSVATPGAQPTGVGYGGQAAYSPLVPLAAVQAATLMSRTVAPLLTSPAAPVAGGHAPALRRVLTTMLERASMSTGNEAAPSRLAASAPELVTPPAPRREAGLAEHLAEQRAQIAAVQRIARASAQRELQATSAPAHPEATRATAQRAEAELRQRAAEQQQQTQAERAGAAAQERARIEERVAQRLAERAASQARLHEQARAEAAAHARRPATEAVTRADAPPASAARRAPAEVTAAIAALPAELSSILLQRPERAMQAIGELGDALRAAELLAHSSASGATFEATRGPRLVMPAGLGGLVATVERAQAISPSRPQPTAVSDTRVPTMAWLRGAGSARPGTPSTALAATASASPAALTHVAWADRWLARFAGAAPQALDSLQSAFARSPELRMQALASAAPGEVFVAPMLGGDVVRRAAPAAPAAAVTSPAMVPPVERYDDAAETPDDVFMQIAAAAASSRAPAAAPAAPPAQLASVPERFTAADAIAHTAPRAPDAGLSAQLASSPFASALRHVLALPVAASFDVRALFGGGLSATYLAGLLAPATSEHAVRDPEREVPAWDATYVAPEPARPGVEAGAEASHTGARRAEPLTMLQTGLLSWTAGDTASAPSPSVPSSASTARGMIDALIRPLLGDTTPASDAGTSWAAPGMIAGRAHDWSVAQERSAADLALDFVPPELVLAARVYGLGPAEAAQAARLALAGPGQLAAMAGTVDRTFVQAMMIDAARKTGGGRSAAAEPASLTTAFPTSSGDLTAVMAPPSGRPGAAFGVERRSPRGSFLWPSASVAALGLNAAGPDDAQSMSVAALELLAAQAVAEIGTYAALADRPPGDARRAPAGDPRSPAGLPDAREPAEADVLGAAAALVPTSRRARFDALYVALSQSPTGSSWSPAARAARALALAGRGEDAPASAYERAAAAWDVLPVVYGADRAAADAVDAQRRGRTRAGRMDGGEPAVFVDGRPGLGALSARAGEALGSYVAPQPSAPNPMSREAAREPSLAPAMRAPTAAQELVRTGRPAGRHGGGEVEIPTWFEAAARKMLEDRSGNADGISMAELTLVTAAPASHVAASTRTVPAAAPIAPAAASAREPAGAAIDIEQVASEIYRQILVMMDAARARNGEPYL